MLLLYILYVNTVFIYYHKSYLITNVILSIPQMDKKQTILNPIFIRKYRKYFLLINALVLTGNGKLILLIQTNVRYVSYYFLVKENYINNTNIYKKVKF